MEQDRSLQHHSKFTVEEDIILRDLVSQYGTRNWVEIAERLGGRNARQCRERWKHYLSGEKVEVPWSPQEDALLFEKVSQWGAKWTRIARFLDGRTDIEVKMRWMKKFNTVVPLFPKAKRTPISVPQDPVPPPAPKPRPVQKNVDTTTELVSIIWPFGFGPSSETGNWVISAASQSYPIQSDDTHTPTSDHITHQNQYVAIRLELFNTFLRLSGG
jgi:hypothetical protein